MQLYLNYKNDNLQINKYRNNGAVCGDLQEFVESMSNSEEATMAVAGVESVDSMVSALEDGSLWPDCDVTKSAIEDLHHFLTR